MEQERYELPNGWEWFPLQEFAYIKGGKRLPKGDVLLETETEYPYIRVSDFNEQGSIDISTVKYISSDTYQKIKRYTISNEDLYISIAGTIGKTGFLPSSIIKANLTENAAKIVFKQKNFAYLKYIYYFTLSNNFSHQIKNSTKTVAQPKLALSRLAQLQIPIPSYTEQRRIADKLDAVLGRIDDAIRLSQDNLASLDDLFASMLQQAFNPLGKTSKETRYELPDGWEWKKLSVIAPPSRQTLLPVSGQQYNYIGLEHIVPNSAKLTDFSPVDGQTIASTKNIFSRNMVLFGKLRPYLRKVHVAQFDGIASTEIIPFQCTADILPEYLAHFMRSDFFINLAVDNCSGSRMPRVTTRFLQTLAFIPLPPLPEQRRIADKLDALSGKIALQKRAIEEKLDELNHLKSSVLDAAFRGRL